MVNMHSPKFFDLLTLFFGAETINIGTSKGYKDLPHSMSMVRDTTACIIEE